MNLPGVPLSIVLNEQVSQTEHCYVVDVFHLPRRIDNASSENLMEIFIEVQASQNWSNAQTVLVLFQW